MENTEPTREDAELALLAAVDDDRIDGLAGHPLAIAILQVLAEDGWLLVPSEDPFRLERIRALIREHPADAVPTVPLAELDRLANG